MSSLEIPLNKIKASPFQPRLEFDLENLKGSILRDGILVPITVRKKDGVYELIDGERRTRLAKELGYKTIPATIVDVDDATARRMVWKVNTLRKDYKPNEKSRYFKKLQDEGMSLSGIARECDESRSNINAYLNIFKLPKEYQKRVWDGIIPIRVIDALSSLLKEGVDVYTPENNPEIFIHLDKASKEKYYGKEEIQEAIKPYLAKIRNEQVKVAKKALAEIEPELEIPVTPNELRKAADALRREAKRKETDKKTPEQLEFEHLEKERKKKEKSEKLQLKREEDKKARAEQESRLRLEAEQKVLANAEAKAQEKIKEEKKRIEQEAKIEIEGIRKNAKEYAKAELVKDPNFIREVRRTVVDLPKPEKMLKPDLLMKESAIPNTQIIVFRISNEVYDKFMKYRHDNELTRHEAGEKLLRKALEIPDV